MLFHAPEFIFGFLPAVLRGLRPGAPFLGLAGGPALARGRLARVLCAMEPGARRPAARPRSSCNFAAARLILARIEHRHIARRVLLAAIAANLVLLGYFKYTNFLIDNLNAIAGCVAAAPAHHPAGRHLVLHLHPDRLSRRGLQPTGRAGSASATTCCSPRCSPASPPARSSCSARCCRSSPPAPSGCSTARAIAVALTVFGIGLCKKLLARRPDRAVRRCRVRRRGGRRGDRAGAAPGSARSPTRCSSTSTSPATPTWRSASAYLFGLRLPLNFNSPLKACSIIEFWRRWHITMTRFFTNYLYSPLALALMRRALARRYGRGRAFSSPARCRSR